MQHHSSQPRYVLGISAFYHDAAAALLREGVIVAAAHEERFTRKKHDDQFPRNAIVYCLTAAGIELSAVSSVVFYDKPFTKFERLLETYYTYAPRGIRSFVAALPVWVREKLFMKDLIARELRALSSATADAPLPEILFSDHHLSHAASAFYPSPYDEAAILTIDGVGEWATSSIAHGTGNTITTLSELHFPHSLGLLYSAVTYYLGFRVNSGEYKVMGLAPYGEPDAPQTKTYVEAIRTKLVRQCDDGSIWLDQRYFNYATGLTMINDRAWEELFGMPRRTAESELTQAYANVAYAVQHVTEAVVIAMAQTAQQRTGSRNLCLAGGVALNCVANSKLLATGLFDNIWIQPAAGDAGGALGAALAVWHQYYGAERVVDGHTDVMQGAYLGPSWNAAEAQHRLRIFNAIPRVYEDRETLNRDVAAHLASGKIVGWFQGRMEWGPRALGNRSILGDPRDPDMQRRMNLKIKFRESFRPFAPIVLEEYASEYFEQPTYSPYMLLVSNVLARRRTPRSAHRHTTLLQTLNEQRSDIPAVTHLDYSARLQSVSRSTNQALWDLLEAFRIQTGCAVLVNTSFNVRGEPIVCTPEDAYRCFMRTNMDYLVIDTLLFVKEEQPTWPEQLTTEATLATD